MKRERKTVWASSWLEKVESGKSDATKAEERSSLLRNTTTANRYLVYGTSAIFIVLLVAGTTVFLIMVT